MLVKARYTKDPGCCACSIAWPDKIASEKCRPCLKQYTYDVEVVAFNVGLFQSEALIQFEDGHFEFADPRRLLIKDHESCQSYHRD